MSYNTASDEDVVPCPYNSVHRVLRKHFQRHLIRCRRSHPYVELIKCPFNAAHLIPEPEYRHHVTTCPDRASISSYKYNVNPETPKTEKVEPSAPEKVNCDDDWDDVNVETYNPQTYVSKAKIIKNVESGGLPSERRNIHQEELKRLPKEEPEDD